MLLELMVIIISFGLMLVVVISGVVILFVVMVVMVVEFSVICSIVVIDYVINSGDMFDLCMIEVMYLFMLLFISICLKVLLLLIINSIMVMILIEEVRVLLICFMEWLWFKLKVNRVISIVIRVVIIGLLKNLVIGRKVWFFGRIILVMVCIVIRIIGISEVQMLMLKSGIFFLVNIFGLCRFFGIGLFIFFRKCVNIGFVRIIVGIVRMVLQSSVLFILVWKMVVIVVGFGCGGRKLWVMESVVVIGMLMYSNGIWVEVVMVNISGSISMKFILQNRVKLMVKLVRIIVY